MAKPCTRKIPFPVFTVSVVYLFDFQSGQNGLTRSPAATTQSRQQLEAAKPVRRRKLFLVTISISVIIPTLNRCQILAEALASVRTQSLPAHAYELIVVDNGSTDKTAQLVQELNRDGGKPIRYVHESRPGLHWARHAGPKRPRAKFTAYTDDDAVVTPVWLHGLKSAYRRIACRAAGGPIHVRWRSQPPA